MKKKIFVICSIILVILAILIYKVSAYFATYCGAIGGLYVCVLDGSDVFLSKKIQIANRNKQEITFNGENYGDGIMYIRIKVFNPSGLSIDYVLDENWYKDNDYLYYNKPLGPGEATTDIKAKLNASNINEGTNFNLIIINESIVATFNKDGSYNPKWTSTINMEESYED